MLRIPENYALEDKQCVSRIERFISDRLLSIMDELAEKCAKSFNQMNEDGSDVATSMVTRLLPEGYPLKDAKNILLQAYRFLQSEEALKPTPIFEHIFFMLILYKDHQCSNSDESKIQKMEEPDRSYVLEKLKQDLEKNPDTYYWDAEEYLSLYEDLGNYQQSLFWDQKMDFLEILN